MRQQTTGDGESESPLSAEHTVKRLDFENIPVSNTSTQNMRAQAQQLRRDLERCREEMTDPAELLESLKANAAEYANVDTSMLWEKYLSLKKEFLQVEAENLFLESYLTSEAEPVQDPEIELDALEKELSELKSMTIKETEDIACLIGTFTEEIENFPKLVESALNHFDECDKKMHVESTEFAEDLMDETSSDAISENEQKALELSVLTGSVQNEIIELELQIFKEKKYYKRIQSLHNTCTKLDLLSKVQSFFCDWIVAGCEDNMVTFVLKNHATTKRKKGTPMKEVVYKLHVEVHPTSLAVQSAQLEPKNEALVDVVLKELALRRMMHSEVSSESHNDLEFFLRRVGQQITSSKRNVA